MSLTLAHLRICLSNCMDVSEGGKALHHRQARSIHERKLLSLSLRAGLHKHTHPQACTGTRAIPVIDQFTRASGYA